MNEMDLRNMQYHLKNIYKDLIQKQKENFCCANASYKGENNETNVFITKNIYWTSYNSRYFISIKYFFSQGNFLARQEMAVSKKALAFGTAAIILLLYDGLGYFGLELSQKIDFADL